MIILKENNRVYIVETIYPYVEDGRVDQQLVPENMPIFKAKGSKTLIAGTELSTLDPLRYVRLPFRKELSQESLLNDISPTVRSIMCDLGRIDEDGEPADLVFAKGDKAFILTENMVCELKDGDAIDGPSALFRYALACTKGIPLLKRIQTVFKAVGKAIDANLFPLIMADTASLKIQVINEEVQ